ncbi:hypothetical protein NRY68_14910 [Acidithiobacillus ferrooxidans]|uniref:hypothetical protein n=1 Tax=Acidithiobacillus ferrooxidans TaxID=920 RepID=UPI002148A2AF|nr:hypothetical protein [Acidithiobacillus ferrooxidans]MCR1347048.1 hypothetical protein [Acidithiobacillus ferrooxidans]MCR1355889.1 hypothetical protein [Acidithiobacillus ferrooxidans]
MTLDTLDLSDIYRNIKTLVKGWRDLFALRMKDADDPLLGGDIRFFVESYFNLPNDSEADLYQPFYHDELQPIDIEELIRFDRKEIDGRLERIARQVKRSQEIVATLSTICPYMVRSVEIWIKLQVRFEYDEVLVPLGMISIPPDVLKTQSWEVYSACSDKLIWINSELRRNDLWLRDEMDGLERYERENLDVEMHDWPEWCRIDLVYRFLPGTWKNLVVRADMLMAEDPSGDFNGIRQHTNGEWAKVNHCWFFHDLYDHHWLALSDLCAIAGWKFSLIRDETFSSIVSL